MPIWPATLPQAPVFGGFSEQKQRNVRSFVPDVGPPRMRRMATAAAVPTVATFEMTDAQRAAFDTFFETDLDDGTLSFTWVHPKNGNTYSWMFDVNEAPQKSTIDYNWNQIVCKLIRLP